MVQGENKSYKLFLAIHTYIDISTHTQPIKCNLVFSKEYTSCRQSPATVNKGRCVKINPAALQSKDSPGRHAPIWFCSLWIILYKLIFTPFDSYLIVRSDYLRGPAGSQTDIEKAMKKYYRLELCTAWSYIYMYMSKSAIHKKHVDIIICKNKMLHKYWIQLMTYMLE